MTHPKIYDRKLRATYKKLLDKLASITYKKQIYTNNL